MKKISARNDTSACLTDDGKVYVWGMDAGLTRHKQKVFDGYRYPALVPSRRFCEDSNAVVKSINQREDKIKHISVGDNMVGVVTESGKVYVWGGNFNGQIGDGTTEYKKVPVLIPQKYFNNEKVIALSLGFNHTGVVTETGKLYLWGHNGSGQLGLGDTTNRTIPTLIPQSRFNNEKVVALSLGYFHSGVETESGKIYVCGNNFSGQLGLGNTRCKSKFKLITQWVM